MDTQELLAKLAQLMNTHPVDSEVVCKFIERHAADEEFAELANLSVKLKLAIAPGQVVRPAIPNLRFRR